MAAGAVAGAAAGLYLGRRYRSFDAFVEDVRDRLGELRSIWYDDELAAEGRGSRIVDAIDDLEDEDEEFEDLEDHHYEDEELYRTYSSDYSEDDLDDEDLDDEEDDLDEEELDELDQDLASVADSNGDALGSRAADKARRLEERVLEALHDDSVLSERAVEIAVVGDGVVELTGTVHAIEEVSRASAMVRNVPGVNMVLNRIDVRTGGNMDTASVAREPVEAPDEDRASPNT